MNRSTKQVTILPISEWLFWQPSKTTNMEYTHIFFKSEILLLCHGFVLMVLLISRFFLKSDLGQGLANQSLHTKPYFFPVFENKILSEHSHVHLFTYCPWLLLHYEKSHRWVVATETIWFAKPKICPIWSFAEIFAHSRSRD